MATQPARLTEAVRIVDTNGVFRTALSYSCDYDYQLDVDDFVNGDDTVNIDPEGLAYDSANDRFVVASEGSGSYDDEDIDRLNWLFQVSLGGVIEKVISLPESVNAIQKSYGFEGVAIDHEGVIIITTAITTTSPSSPHFPPPPGGHRPGAPLPQSPTHSADDTPISTTD